MPYSLIVSDVDGCLSPEESVGWDYGALSMLAARLRGTPPGGRSPHDDRRLPFTLCTGRPQPYVEALMKVLDIRLPSICESGAVIYRLSDNRSVFGPGVTAEKLEELFEIRHFVTSDLLPRFPGAVHQFGKEAQISVFSADASRIPLLADEVREFATRFSDDPVEVTWSHYYLNISLRGVTKGSAVEAVMDELGVRPEEVAAIGDTEGDLPLREHAAWFGCPANATPEIKARADYISEYRDIHGLLDILGRIVDR